MKQKLVKILKNVFLLILFTTFLFAGDVQDDLTDTSLQNTYGIKDGGVISASNLRTLFMKLASGAWSTNGTSIYYNKGNVGIGTSNPIYPLDINHNAPWGYAIKLNAPENNDNLIAFFKNNNENKKWVIGLDNGNDAGPYDFAIWTNTNNLGYVMTMKENGLIGIGTNNPQTHLHVYGNTATSHTYIRSEGLFGVFQSFSNGKSSLFFTDPNTGNLILRAGTIDSLFINPENGNVGLGGNLGIGTLSPTSKLHVANASGDTSIVVEKSDYSYGASILELKTSDGAGSFKKMHIGLGSGARGDQLSNKFYLLDYEKGIRMVIDDNGNVGIGTTSPTEKLTVAGNIYASGTVTQASDFRYKKNINPLENALEKVLSLHGVSFEWKREEYQEKHFTQGKNMGFIAQEAEKVVPEVVQTGKDGYKSMAYANLTALLVEAFKELNGKFEKTLRENEEMKQEINELKIQNQELLKRLTAYESKMKKIDSLLSNLNQKVVQ